MERLVDEARGSSRLLSGARLAGYAVQGRRDLHD